MADELIEFPRTMEVLQRLADDVKAGYIDQLEKHKHPTKYGENRLSDTITTIVEANGMQFSASLKMNYYWKYLEEGTRPHWPPRDAILRWVEIKPVIPRPAGNGRIPTPKQLAYLISRKIANEGTQGTHGFQTTRDALVPFYIDELEKAFNEDIGFYLMKVFRMNSEF